jgi:hypothetical protein
MESIYLVGQISPKFKETYEWRERVRDYFSVKSHVRIDGTPNLTIYERQKINIIDPCNNSFNKKVLDENRYAITIDSRSKGLDLLVSKDLNAVKRSSIAIVNMNHYDINKPMLGSFFELGWYFFIS